MRVLICGDRNWTDYRAIEEYVESLPPNSVVIEGECRGADVMARTAALKYGHRVLRFPAEWGRYGKAAGPIRTKQMLVEGRPERVVNRSRRS